VQLGGSDEGGFLASENLILGKYFFSHPRNAQFSIVTTKQHFLLIGQYKVPTT
jgi:hypothetical protein